MKHSAKSHKEDHRIWSNEILHHLPKPTHNSQRSTEMEKSFLQRLHWMRCPKCGHRLKNEYRGPAMTQVCSNCRGLWLDADQLDIVESRSTPADARSKPTDIA